jgi:hypothetical protein
MTEHNSDADNNLDFSIIKHNSMKVYNEFDAQYITNFIKKQ